MGLRRAIVTGASSGIGRATAILLAERGLDVGITYSSNRAGAEETAEQVSIRGQRAVVSQLDQAEPPEVERGLQELIDRLGGIDVLINNAGINRREAAIDETLQSWTRVIEVNLTSAWLCARTAARAMDKAGRGGRIVNVTSVLAFAPLSGGAAYCVAKAGLDALTRVMALELSSSDITVTSVAPGHTLTPMNYDNLDLAATEIQRPVIPLARPAEPTEIAAAIAFLASPDASYVTGASLLVDGGLLAHSGPEALQEATGAPPSRS